MHEEELAVVRQEIADRLDQLSLELGRLSDREILQEVHSLKGLAQTFDLCTVAALAHSLEGEMGSFGRAVAVPYLDHMHEALDLAPGEDPQALRLFLTSIRARLAPA